MDADIHKYYTGPSKTEQVEAAKTTSSGIFKNWLKNKGFELAGNALGGGPTHVAEPPNRKLPPDFVLRQYMNQPVEKTLKGTGVVYVGPLNIEKEVFGAKKHVILLFYTRTGKLDRGLAAFAKTFLDWNPKKFKMCAYEMADAEFWVKNQEKFEVYQSRYGINGIPWLSFYEYKDGIIELDGYVRGGYEKLGRLKRSINELSGKIERDMNILE